MFFKRISLLITLSFSLFIISCKDNKKVIKQTEITFTKEGELTIFKASDSTKVALNIEISDTDWKEIVALAKNVDLEKVKDLKLRMAIQLIYCKFSIPNT